MARFLGYWGPTVWEILHLPRPSKATLVVPKKKEKGKDPKERDPPQRGQGHTAILSHLRVTNLTMSLLTPQHSSNTWVLWTFTSLYFSECFRLQIQKAALPRLGPCLSSRVFWLSPDL